jgi:S1-C subfamily serine protease
MDRAGIMLFKVSPNVEFKELSCVTNPYRFAYPDFRYKIGAQPEFLIKGVDKNDAWLGVTLGPFKSGDVKENGVLAGGFIIEIFPDSPADKAGLQYGDIIIMLNERNGTYAELIPEIMSSSAIGDNLDIYFIRENETFQTQALLAKIQNDDYF